MYKMRNKRMALIIAVVFALSIMLPVAAFAGNDVTFSNAVQRGIDDGTDTALGWIKIDIDDETVAEDVYIWATVELPDGVDYKAAATSDTLSDYVTAMDRGTSAATADTLDIVGTAATDELTVKVYDPEGIDYIKFEFDTAGTSKVFVDDGFSGDIDVKVTVRATEGGFELWPTPYTYTATVGKVGDAEITVSADDPKTVSAGSGKELATVTLEESLKGALSVGDVVYLELVNDDEFSFDGFTVNKEVYTSRTISSKYGLAADVERVSGSKIKVTITSPSENFADTLEITPVVTVFPFASGDVEVEVYCDTNDDFEDKTVVLGVVGDADVTVTADLDDADTIYPATVAGTGNKIATLEFEGSAKFADGERFTLTLPEGFEWASQEDFTGFNALGIFNDNRSLWYEVAGVNDDEFELAGLQINVAADAPRGDIVVEIAGDLVETSVVVGECVDRAAITAEVAEVEIGLSQAAGDITIVETEKDSLDNDKVIKLSLPSGVEFSGKPTVEVNGDEISVGDTWKGESEGTITLDKMRSAKVDTIVISGIEYDIDSRVPFDDIEIEIGGTAFNALLTDGTKVNDTDKDDPVLYLVNATLVDGSKVTTSFTAGDEGVTIVNGRTLVQVNKLCDILGLQKSWDSATKTAYFVKGGKIVAFPMGENAIYINGVKVPVDQGGMIINDYTYATLRGLQMAFDGELEWDDATKTATFTFTK